MIKHFLTVMVTSTILLTGCQSTNKQKISSLERAGEGTYCRVEDTSGGVVFISNKIALNSAKVLGELPSCKVLYDTFYRYGPIDKEITALKEGVRQLNSRVRALEQK